MGMSVAANHAKGKFAADVIGSNNLLSSLMLMLLWQLRHVAQKTLRKMGLMLS